ncbi:MAG: protein-glutamate O-methyltransferase family protein [Anaerolineales bacterium]|nr:protein-glutamate O-methyltransferase family protein [Anaerolineales bacterium]
MTPLPPFLMTSEQGSFAQHTVKNRFPEIIDQILKHNDYTALIESELIAFKQEIAHHVIQPLTEQTSDRPLWDEDLKPWSGKTWFELPWFFAETFFYRRLLEIVNYFHAGPFMSRDPFKPLKVQEISKATPQFLETFEPVPSDTSFEHFQHTCTQALWGNRGDLSHSTSYSTDMDAQYDRIILNHTKAVYAFLSRKPAKIAYIMDNAGKELFFDFAFMDFLLLSGMATSITCYVKNQPYYVSDLMSEDFLMSLRILSASTNNNVQNLGLRSENYLDSTLMRVKSPPFFTTSRMYRDLPDTLKNEIAHHDLAILKGDVNYRRLVGDRHWPHTTPIEVAAGYFPTSFLSLRTLKAELAVGLSSEILRKIESENEPDWLTNGKRGMITFLHRQK